MELVHATYELCEEGRPPIIKARVIENGKITQRMIESTVFPYFHILRRHRIRAEKIISKHVKHYNFVDVNSIFVFLGEPTLKVEISRPFDVPRIRRDLHEHDIPTFESDVPYIRRWMVDTDMKFTEISKPLYFDIEVDAAKGFPEPEEADRMIVSIAAIDDEDNEFFYYAKDESEEEDLIKDFYQLCMDYTVVCGWNSEDFDFLYLDTRSKNLGLNLNWNHVNRLDIMLCIKKVRRYGERNYTLQYFAEKYLGESKKFEADWYDNREKMIHLLKNPEDLKEYNIHDARLVKMIDKKFEMSDVYCMLATLQYVFPTDTKFRGVGCDAALLRFSLTEYDPKQIWPMRAFSKKEDYPFKPSEPKIPTNESQDLKGGLVLYPVPGRHEWTVLLDFSSMYTSIIRTFNVGIRTKTEKVFRFTDVHGAENGFLLFDHSGESIFSKLVKQLIEKRAKYKTLERKFPKDSLEYQHYRTIQRALKVALLANWGIIGDDDSRVYDYDVASSITAVGRYLIELTKEIAEEVGLKVVAGDTDSVFIAWGDREDYNLDKILEMAREFESYANKRITEILQEKFDLPDETYSINLELGKVYRTIRFPASGAKKRYMGLVLWEDQLKYETEVIGFESARSDAPVLIQEIQDRIFEMDVEESRPVEDIKDYLRSLCKEVFDGRIDHKLVKSVGLGKSIDQYKVIPPHVKAAMKHPGIVPGDKVHFVVLSNKGKQKVAPVVGSKIPDIPVDGYKYVWDSLVAPMLERTFGKEFVMRSVEAFCQPLEKWFG